MITVTVSPSEGRQATVTQIVQGAESPKTPVVVGPGQSHNFYCEGGSPETMDTFLVQEDVYYEPGEFVEVAESDAAAVEGQGG